MKNLILPFKFIFFCTLFTCQIQAQNNSPYLGPSPEIVENLLNRIENCKTSLAKYEIMLTNYENNPDDYYYSDYLTMKTLKRDAEGCIAMSRMELDELREEYPEWFNQTPGVISSPNRDHEMSPEELEIIKKVVKNMENRIAALKKRFNTLPIPD